MKKILFTGGSGFVGRNVLPFLKQNHYVAAPTRHELNLKDDRAIEEYIRSENFDVVIHCANPNPVKNAQEDSQSTMLEDSLRIFMNFYRVRAYYGKMLYLGSGAECDKTTNICNIDENNAQRLIPKDIYGFAKYIMNELALQSTNIFNLRLFACYGPFDHESKFITHCIQCCLNNEPLTIRQNCMFDYIHVFDLAKILLYAIDHDLTEHVYNIGSGKKISLLDIAKKVRRQTGVSTPIKVLKEGWNKEYTPNISRLEMETGLINNFLPLEEGIAMQIAHERRLKK